MDQLPRLGKRELICLLLFTCNSVIMWFLLGEVSSSSGCLGWATLFYCGTMSLPYNYFLKNLTHIVTDSGMAFSFNALPPL